jgi:hypothetical protein
VARSAGAIASAGMIEWDAEIQSHIQNGLLESMILVGKFAVLELHRLAFGQECDLNRIFAGRFDRGRPGS